MQKTFFVELQFWMEGLEASRYENNISGKKIEDRMGITLQSLKIYGYIGSKIKSYQVQIRFFLLVTFLTSRL